MFAFLFLGATKALHRCEGQTTGTSQSYPGVHCDFITTPWSSMFLMRSWHFLLNSDIWKYRTNIPHFFGTADLADTDISGFIGFCRTVTQIICCQVLTLFFPLHGQVDKKKAEVGAVLDDSTKTSLEFSFYVYMGTLFETLIKSQAGVR